jgi:hypothetical protein
MKKPLVVIAAVLILSLIGFAQSPPPPTNTAQFTVNLNFLGAAPYGQTSALSVAATNQLTTNSLLRLDVIDMTGVGYSGYFVGPQYNACAFTFLEKLLASTSFNCGVFEPYLNGAAGYGRVQQNGGPVSHGIAFLFRTGANYSPTKTVGFNLYEIGCGDFGAEVVGQTKVGCFAQTGLNFYLGSSASATAAKRARANRSNAKRLKRLNELSRQN